MENMTLYIPFGADCFPSSIIYHGGLNRLSMPFDSVFAFAPNLKHILDTDFKFFMEKQYLSLHKKDNKITTSHSMYPVFIKEERKIYDAAPGDVFFNHHNLMDGDTINKYKYKINNFKNTIKSNESILFLSSINVEYLLSNNLYNYFNRKAKTMYVTCDWKYSGDRKIEVKENYGIKHIDVFSPKKFNDKESCLIAAEYIRSLDI